MKIIVTSEQLNAAMTVEQKALAGYTDEILEKAELQNIRLIDCVIGDIEETADGRFIVNPNLSNPNKLPRKVAINRLTEEQKEYWINAVGEENIITE